MKHEHREAVDHLRAVDPLLAGVIERVGTFPPEPDDSGSHFQAILRAIVYQQLSGRAAAAILGRILALYGGRAPLPEELLVTAEDRLRDAGLSRQKIRYARDLAQKAASGELALESLHERDDEEIIEALRSVQGVGVWTAQMFLIFRLGRPDVLPDADLGVRKAVQSIYGLDSLPAPARVREVGAPWRPYRSIASWYLWRSLELEPLPAPAGQSGMSNSSL